MGFKPARWDVRGFDGHGQEIAGPALLTGYPLVVAALEGGLFILDGHFHGIDHIYAVTGIHAAAQDAQMSQLFFPDLQQSGSLGGECGHAGIRWEFDIFNLQQGVRFLSTDISIISQFLGQGNHDIHI